MAPFDQTKGKDVYAIVRSGSRQHKVAVGDVIDIDQEVLPGDSLALTALMLVDGDSVICDAAKLAKAKVTAEAIGPTRGPKIRILKFKNKSGKAKRQGHRQKYTRIKITGIKG